MKNNNLRGRLSSLETPLSIPSSVARTRLLPLALALAVSAAMPCAFAGESAPSVIHIQSQPLGSALSQNRGLVGINQGAGEGNQQLNAFALSLDDSGLGVVTDINLSSSVAKTPGGKPPANTTTSIYLDDTALTGSKGVIQVNQVTGQGNQSVNMVSLPLAGAVTASP